ncbi:PIN domain-containing protein [Flavihumibacter petaseus]|uniref:PIN like domain-containing protein n=1 Tax=Flavihumibacter petaseus NBRC 106054 TaxID=1220578 RepID=A0A0E9MX41_9BACT|nr:PIN domain-containing protein [Flavihumibacter petaseus]GAO42312.1 hypothetical protein FPE01S_01_13250 [Flavihumibacter petaseus NBRC 106054]
MKGTFSSFNKLDPNGFSELWKTCYFAFDTNVLLNLYRYSKITRDEIINAIGSQKGRLFLPHQVGLEFHRNRYDIIAGQISTLEENAKMLQTVLGKFDSKFASLFLEKGNENNLREALNNAIADLQRQQKQVEELLKKDEIYDIVVNIFPDEIVGQPFDDKALEVIYKDGERRYTEKVPPGYADAKDKSDKRKYGDLIIWHQLVDFAKSQKRSIIFVTNDIKEDWIWHGTVRSMKHGTRFELREEMKAKTGVDFHLCNTEMFLNSARIFSGTAASSRAIDEIVTVEQQGIVIENDGNEKKGDRLYNYLRKTYPGRSDDLLLTTLNRLFNLKRGLYLSLDELSKKEVLTIADKNQIKDTEAQLASVEERIADLMEKLKG